MCGLFNLHDNPAVRALMLSIGLPPDTVGLKFGIHSPGDKVSIVSEFFGERQLLEAKWHLYLVHQDGEWKFMPKYWSINTRADKLAKKAEYRHARILIPATAFVESQNGKHPHLLEFVDRAFVFGGLMKHWRDKASGDEILSCSIITLPGHEKLANIHEKSLPLILDHEDTASIDAWLDPQFTDTDAFADLLNTRLRWDMRATPINKSTKQEPIAKPFIIKKD